MFALGMFASMVKMQLADHLMQDSSIGTHNENKISKEELEVRGEQI